MAKFGPFPAPMVSEVVGNGCKMILTTFYYHLLLWKSALNGPLEAADNPYLHLGVALETTLGIRNFWVFLIQLTFPSMGKVVSSLLEFLRILGTTGGCTV